ncbi:MAG: Nucleotidyltransferase domain protein [Spirochaetes bacterium ADurb.Bin110]|nr:MAG: Nucleotidyltransferase domain protein [Spirochaetes bacterium ADurb.Bin110]
MELLPLSIEEQKLEAIAQEYSIRSIALFGSVLRSDFGPKSDIDILIELSPGRHYSYFDLLDIKSRFEEVFNRKVDLIEKESLRNPYRRKAILSTARTIYADHY